MQVFWNTNSALMKTHHGIPDARNWKWNWWHDLLSDHCKFHIFHTDLRTQFMLHQKQQKTLKIKHFKNLKICINSTSLDLLNVCFSWRQNTWQARQQIESNLCILDWLYKSDADFMHAYMILGCRNCLYLFCYPVIFLLFLTGYIKYWHLNAFKVLGTSSVLSVLVRVVSLSLF